MTLHTKLTLLFSLAWLIAVGSAIHQRRQLKATQQQRDTLAQTLDSERNKTQALIHANAQLNQQLQNAQQHAAQQQSQINHALQNNHQWAAQTLPADIQKALNP
ncbi:hypothetical protein [Kingella sp. (in: b-proteobacteria)]|uniref:hypothetical protein n=1 Tax=Kingella sp. (in: b-proteobacteria) TaxID=2020713 RepID=UPI0026DD056D|nr:hypothetical protein [Kingella sp. (in: b-proteobacteria)]MDO4658336.1 hypothetical protein [Kingella sp. (in: b-proteobacteria)]